MWKLPVCTVCNGEILGNETGERNNSIAKLLNIARSGNSLSELLEKVD
jgi:hypothetical protein